MVRLFGKHGFITEIFKTKLISIYSKYHETVQFDIYTT